MDVLVTSSWRLGEGRSHGVAVVAEGLVELMDPDFDVPQPRRAG